MNYNPKDWYWSISGITDLVWSSASNALVSVSDTAFENWLDAGNTPTHVASVNVALAVTIMEADLLGSSDTTMLRIAEAVAVGLTSWTAADVVAWVNWRRALRAIVSGSDTSSASIPSRPAYPSGS
jgi:hypothetical protein